MSTVIETINTIQQQSADDYDALVASMASGEIPRPKAVRETLISSGKNLDDLHTDAQRLVDRHEAKQKLEQADAMDAEIAEAQKQHAEALADREKLILEFNEKNTITAIVVQGAYAALESLLKKQRELRTSARKTLAATADISVNEQLAELARERSELLHILEVNEHREPVIVESEIEEARVKFKDCLDKHAEAEAGQVRLRLERLKAELKRSQQKAEFCAEYKTKLADVDAKIAALERTKMEP